MEECPFRGNNRAERLPFGDIFFQRNFDFIEAVIIELWKPWWSSIKIIMRNFIRGKALFDRLSALTSTIFKNLFAWHVLTVEKILCFAWPKGQSSSNVCENILIHVSLQIPWEKTSCFFNISIHWFSLGSKIYGRKVSKMHHILWVPLRDIRRTNRIVKCV